MSEHTWFIVAIIIYMAAMLLIGYWSYRNTDEYGDYVLAGRQLNPTVAALSAGASDMSGWLLMGLPGALFVTGMSELWIAIGLLIGCWANWKWVAPRLRAYSEVAEDSITIPSFFENRLMDSSRALRVISALIIIIFFTFYVSAGMVSGGRYFESTFGTAYLDGMLIVAFITVAYTFVGGFLAVSYTDAVQGTLMFLSLIAVPVAALLYLGDPSTIWNWAPNHDYGPYTDGVGNPTYFSLLQGVTFTAIISNLAWGLGYFGQPHIVVRFMALRSSQDARQARRIGMGWMLFSILGAVATAIVATAFFGQHPEYTIADQSSFETIFLDMGQVLFHPLVAGIILTAVLAAIMSTISSQLLVTSTSLIEDLFKIARKNPPSNATMMNLSRIAVIAVATVAAILAIHPSDSILNLVAFAWAGFGAAFGPLMILSLYWRRLNTAGAISGVITGAAVVFAWGSSSWSDTIYEMIPGFGAALLVTVLVSLLTTPPPARVAEEFDEAVTLSHQQAAVASE